MSNWFKLLVWRLFFSRIQMFPSGAETKQSSNREKWTETSVTETSKPVRRWSHEGSSFMESFVRLMNSCKAEFQSVSLTMKVSSLWVAVTCDQAMTSWCHQYLSNHIQEKDDRCVDLINICRKNKLCFPISLIRSNSQLISSSQVCSTKLMLTVSC